MKRWMLSAAVAATTLTFLPGPAMAAPPEPLDFHATIPAGGLCSFTLDVVATGKQKSIGLPGGRTTNTSPNQNVTLTNLDTGKSVSYVVTGAFHHQTVNGNDVVKVTGRNLLTTPEPGVFITVGNFNYVLGPNGEELQRFTGSGRVIDACQALS